MYMSLLVVALGKFVKSVIITSSGRNQGVNEFVLCCIAMGISSALAADSVWANVEGYF